MKALATSLVILVSTLCATCIAKAESLKPEKVHRLTRVNQPREWYTTQAGLWKGEIENDPKNSGAWYNYYFASRYSLNKRTKSGRATLDRIISDMGKAIPDSYQYLYTKFLNDDLKDITLLERAHQLRPDNPEHYENFVHIYELSNEREKAKIYWEKLYRSGYIPAAWLNYNYNTLMSTEEDAILFTNGDNDTYPAWMLQRAKGVRSDVTILNVFLCRKKPYLLRVLQEKGIKISPEELPDSDAENWLLELCNTLIANNPNIPIYFGITLPRRYIGPLQDNLYLVGLAHQYSPKRVDNMALLAKNLEKRFRLNYLRHDWYSEAHVSEKSIRENHNLNYIIPFMMLYEHYKAGGERERADYWRELSLDLAQKGNSKGMLNYIKKRG